MNMFSQTRSALRCAPILAALFVFLCAQLPGQSYTIEDLGTFTGNGISWATGINNHGHVTGSADWPVPPNSPPGSEAWHAFLWDGQTLQHVAPITPNLGFGIDLNDDDVVVGYCTSGPNFGAFRWEGGVTTDIHCGELNYSRAHAINRVGDIVGIYALMVPGNWVSQYQGYARRDGVWKGLGTFGGDASGVTDINELGQAVGSADDATGVMVPCLWEKGSMIDLGGFGGLFGKASGINNFTQIVGWSADPLAKARGFLWERGIMRDIGDLGGAQCWPRAINSSGAIVGQASVPSGATHAFLYASGVMTDLNSLLPAGSGWELLDASDINELGEICGTGTIGGESRAFVMTPVLTAPRTSPPVPGLVNQMNSVYAIAAHPGSTLHLVAGLQVGSWQVPNCPGLFLDIADPHQISVATADPFGRAEFEAWIPPQLSGVLFYYQVVDAVNCQVGELTAFAAP